MFSLFGWYLSTVFKGKPTILGGAYSDTDPCACVVGDAGSEEKAATKIQAVQRGKVARAACAAEERARRALPRTLRSVDWDGSWIGNPPLGAQLPFFSLFWEGFPLKVNQPKKNP